MLTTARYYTPSGRSIQAKGIEPGAVVEEELPKDMNKAPENMEGEANLRGHLRSEGNDSQEESGSSSYVSPEKNKDTQLQYALELMRGSVRRHQRQPAVTAGGSALVDVGYGS